MPRLKETPLSESRLLVYFEFFQPNKIMEESQNGIWLSSQAQKTVSCCKLSREVEIV
jgi:hypothetical protein